MKKQMIALAAASTFAAVQAAELPIDKDHTSVTFSIAHMVISRVQGSFTEFDGSLSMEDGALTGMNATVQIGSINTANARRDGHLKSDDFFDAESFPTMTFESTSVADGKITGNLTIKGVTREVTFDFTMQGPATDPWGNVRHGLTATGTINRTDFGLTWNQAIEAGGVLVGETVDITINTQVILPN